MFDPSGPGAKQRAEMLKSVTQLVKASVEGLAHDVKHIDAEVSSNHRQLTSSARVISATDSSLTTLYLFMIGRAWIPQSQNQKVRDHGNAQRQVSACRTPGSQRHRLTVTYILFALISWPRCSCIPFHIPISSAQPSYSHTLHRHTHIHMQAFFVLFCHLCVGPRFSQLLHQLICRDSVSKDLCCSVPKNQLSSAYLVRLCLAHESFSTYLCPPDATLGCHIDIFSSTYARRVRHHLEC